eukprot:3257414-Pleurochrysis_carterae.AAC.2
MKSAPAYVYVLPLHRFSSTASQGSASERERPWRARRMSQVIGPSRFAQRPPSHLQTWNVSVPSVRLTDDTQVSFVVNSAQMVLEPWWIESTARDSKSEHREFGAKGQGVWVEVSHAHFSVSLSQEQSV